MNKTALYERQLARSVAKLKPSAMQVFVAELAKHRGRLLDDLADVIISLRRRKETRRDFRAFWDGMNKGHSA